MTIQLQQRSLTLEIQETQQKLDDLLQELRDHTQEHDDKLRRTLMSHVGTVYQHIQELKAAPSTPYMISEAEVVKIEARTTEEIMVMTADFHYELEVQIPGALTDEDTYPEIIAANLLKEPKPVSYKYVVRGEGSTLASLGKLLGEILRAMNKLDQQGRSDRELRELVARNYDVRTLTPSAWNKAAAAAMFGFAIYQVGPREEWLIQYPPLRFSGLNLCVPVNDRDGRYALSSMRFCFDRYYGQARRPDAVYEQFLNPNMQSRR